MNIRVISFNIWCRDDKEGHSIAERSPRLYEAVAPYDADVIGFQEFQPKWEKHIKEYFGDKYAIFNKYRDSQDPESTPILWKKDKFDLIDKGFFWLSDTPEEESQGWDERGHNRICIYVILKDKKTNTCFTYMNTHYGFGDECHIKSSLLLSDYVKKISDLPTFVTGDFNMCPDRLGYAEITKYFTDANAVTVKDTRSTYHACDPENHPNSHIDYCFVNDKVTPLARELIDKSFNGKYPSDHFGIYMELEI